MILIYLENTQEQKTVIKELGQLDYKIINSFSQAIDYLDEFTAIDALICKPNILDLDFQKLLKFNESLPIENKNFIFNIQSFLEDFRSKRLKMNVKQILSLAESEIGRINGFKYFFKIKHIHLEIYTITSGMLKIIGNNIKPKYFLEEPVNIKISIRERRFKDSIKIIEFYSEEVEGQKVYCLKTEQDLSGLINFLYLSQEFLGEEN